MENTSIRLQRLMKERGLKQIDILNLAAPYCKQFNVKLNKSDLSQYINGKFAPGQWKLTILGLALNVSEAWLMGYDVPRDRSPESIPPLPPQSMPDMPSVQESEPLFIAFHSLNCEGQQKLLDYAADLVASGRYAISQESDIKLDASELKEVADALFSIDQ